MLVVIAILVVPSLARPVVLGTAVVPTVVPTLTSAVVVEDVAFCVAKVEASPGAEVAEAVVVLLSVILEVLAVLVASMDTVVGCGMMVVVPSF